MKSRCLNPNTRCFEIYGGDGVKICARWLDKEHGFENFLHDMGNRPAGTSLGRFVDSGHYEPINCAWMTPTQQGLERRKKTALWKAA